MHDISKLKDHIRENRLYLNRAVCATIVILAVFLGLIVRVFYLQIIKHDLYATLAKNNRVRMIPLSPPRGLIYDRNGTLLAENIPTFSLTIAPSQAKNLKTTISKINEIIPLSEHEIENFYKQIKYKGRYEDIPIKTKLSEDQVAKISLQKYNLPGVDISASLSRIYNFKEPLSHIVGYIGPISETDLKSIDIKDYRSIHQIGKIGVEKYYENELKGDLGFQHVETNSRGRILRAIGEDLAIPGKDIHLTIDIHLQKFIAKLMGNKKGALVAISPKTGEIIAMVSNPGFNSNLFVKGISKDEYNKLVKDKAMPMFNRAIKGMYPPGSTVKPIIALRALEDGIITPKDNVYDPGFYRINNAGRKFRCWAYHGHGKVNLLRALGESCGTYFYNVALKMGIDKLHSTFSNFNLGKKTEIDIYGEEQGLAPSSKWKKRVKKSAWFAGETLNVGIGQGYTLATPLQIAVMTSAIANRGEVIQPRIVARLTNSTNPELNLLPPANRSHVAVKDDINWDLIIEGMERTTKHKWGTAHKYFKDFPYSVAGKTGTAQVFSLAENQRYNKDEVAKHLRDHSWFMAFAPIDEPKIAVAAIIENDKGAPKIVRDVLEHYLSNY